MRYSNFFKPAFDRMVGIVGLIILSPILLLIALVLFFHFKESPFFLQERVGKDSRIFHVVKFKTMNSSRCSEGHLLEDDKRITSVGRWIRHFSIDELPQLYNLAVGNMSLIGPRPLLVEYLPLYSPEQAQRHLVKPGITGLAQVNGRNMISWEDKFAWDIKYVQNQCLQLDLLILIKSVKSAVDGSGIYGEGGVVRKFEGNK